MYEKGVRCLIKGLRSSAELNDSVVEIVSPPRTRHPDRHKARIIVPSQRRNTSGKVLGLKEVNLAQCEVQWTEVGTRTNVHDGTKCRSHLGCVAYSRTAMYVFGGLGPVDVDSDDEHSESDFLPPRMSDVWSLSHKSLEWKCHWWRNLPGPRIYYEQELGTPGVPCDTDLSVSPPLDCSGTLLVLLHNHWTQVPTRGSKPAGFLQGKHFKSYNRENRKCSNSAVLVPDENGVRLVFWSGLFWTPISGDSRDSTIPRNQVEAAIRGNVAMTGMFELFIPNEYLSSTGPAPSTAASPTWSLLKQYGPDMPMPRYQHSLTLVGNDLVVVGGESCEGMGPQLPEHSGTDQELGHYAYNLKTNEWRKLEFHVNIAGTRMHTECMSDHLAFPILPSKLDTDTLKLYRQQLLTAATCCNANGLLPRGAPDIWKRVWSYLAPPGRGRLLIVRQYDDIYRHADEDEDVDHMVLMLNLMTMEAIPLSTFSMIQNGRDDEGEDENSGRLLFGLEETWVNAAIFPSPSGDGTRLIVHGKLSTMGGRNQGLGSGDYGVFATLIR